MRLILLSTLFACGGGDGSGGVSPQQLPGELASVTCARLTECCTAEEFMDATLGQDTEVECRQLFTGFAGLLGDVIDDSIAAGRVIYHGDRMEECLALIGDVPCSQFDKVNSAPFPNSQCEDPFEGQVDLGGECAQDFDCISEFCAGDSLDFEGNITFGVCIDPPLAGDPCDDNECAEGAFCESGGESTCRDTLPDGATCNGDDECESGGCNGEPGLATCGPSMTCDGV